MIKVHAYLSHRTLIRIFKVKNKYNGLVSKMLYRKEYKY